MTYLAPRQVLFAIILLISFLIHTTLLLISTNQQLDALKMQTGERMLVQLIEEVKLPLLSKDKVSLSVLTGRYTSEKNVASLTIKDIDGDVILQTGQAQLLTGDVISQKVILSDNVIGKVSLTLRDTSNGEIISSQWLFILGSFITHLLIWLVYGYVARPTRAQLTALSRDVQNHLISQQRIQVKRTRRNEVPSFDTADDRLDDDRPDDDELDESLDAVAAEDANNRHKSSTGFNIKQAVNQYVKTHRNDGHDLNDDSNDDVDSGAHNDVEEGNETSTTNHRRRFRDHFSRRGATKSERDVADFDDTADETASENAALNKSNPSNSHINKAGDSNGNDAKETVTVGIDASANTVEPSGLSINKSPYAGKLDARHRPPLASRPIDKAVVQIQFADPHNLIATLAPEQADPYYALCTQLLQKTVTELLKQPLLHGVTVSNGADFAGNFDEHGAQVAFIGENSFSKAGLAAMMFAKVYMMLHEITCIKLRELGRFSADVYIGVSDAAVAEHMQHVLQHNANAHDIYALLPTAGIKQLNGHMQLNSLPKPTTVYERDCAYLEGVGNTMMQRLADVRNVVLLSSQ